MDEYQIDSISMPVVSILYIQVINAPTRHVSASSGKKNSVSTAPILPVAATRASANNNISPMNAGLRPSRSANVAAVTRP